MNSSTCNMKLGNIFNICTKPYFKLLVVIEKFDVYTLWCCLYVTVVYRNILAELKQAESCNILRLADLALSPLVLQPAIMALQAQTSLKELHLPGEKQVYNEKHFFSYLVHLCACAFVFVYWHCFKPIFKTVVLLLQ